ncbi:MAG: LacI family DNA-binding transcriptional regulator [Treponemataceae bacterium]
MEQIEGSTIYDVAAAAGVSISTVSRCLNSPGKVNADTLASVTNAIHRLGYIPHGNTGPKRHRRVGRIGVLTPNFLAPSFVQRLQGISQVLRKRMTEMVVYSFETDEELNEYLHSVPFTKRIDGLVIASARIPDAVAARMAKTDLPIVSMEYASPYFPSVVADNVRGGQLAGRHFAERGYQPCAYLGEDVKQPFSLQPSEARLRGYAEALAAAGTPLEAAYIRLGTFEPENARAMAGELLDLPRPPRALFCMCDLQAFGAIKAARERGLRIPEDIAILGFDDIEAAEYMELSTVSQSLLESGKMTAEILLSKIEDPKRTIGVVSLDVSLVLRKTT